ncbi:hypothetical protein SLEP1_g10319 [Rubroshorea leprosula]|uniref:Uncharacterized protein n=1 Tax=Rubroshorea leprosula TaxID=152421 RepID=A0AAV5IHL8_9ROSI|nr:hypothetical protein SLEP1_g10319 [Rubroshorea leprosula]
MKLKGCTKWQQMKKGELHQSMVAAKCRKLCCKC